MTRFLNYMKSRKFKIFNQRFISSMASSLFWGVWGLFQYQNSSVEFDYLEYSKKRMEIYYLWKNNYFKEFKTSKL
jgi:hypothetical protein